MSQSQTYEAMSNNLYFDPFNVNDISKKIELFIENKNLKSELSIKSLNRVKELPNYKDVTLKTYKIIKKLKK